MVMYTRHIDNYWNISIIHDAYYHSISGLCDFYYHSISVVCVIFLMDEDSLTSERMGGLMKG